MSLHLNAIPLSATTVLRIPAWEAGFKERHAAGQVGPWADHRGVWLTGSGEHGDSGRRHWLVNHGEGLLARCSGTYPDSAGACRAIDIVLDSASEPFDVETR